MLASLMLLLAAGCAPRGAVGPTEPGATEAVQPAAPATGALVRLEDGQLRPLSDAAFQKLASEADYVLLGEGHTVACDHETQARLLELLAQSDRQWAVGLEMMGADQQSRLDAVNRQAKRLYNDPESLQRELQWEQNWGYGYDLYAPVLETALRLDMPLYALNIPRGLLRELRRKGRDNLTSEQRKWLPEEVIPPLEAQKKSLRQVFSVHQEFMAGQSKDQDKLDERLERFFLVQSIWDTVMARRALKLQQKTGRAVAVIAGSGHVEKGWGIAHRLRSLQPDARVLLVMPWRGGEPPEPELGDLHYYCPESVTTKQGLTLSWVPDEEGGFALVEAVSPDSLADRADLRPGDAIIEADGRRLGSLGGLHLAAITVKRKNRPLQLLLRRNGYLLNLTLPLSQKTD